MAEIEIELAERIRRSEPVVLATVIRLNGEPPSHAGAKALFNGEAGLAGTLGCAEFDGKARLIRRRETYEDLLAPEIL